MAVKLDSCLQFPFAMDSDEAADFLLPCAICTKNCYTIHGKQKDEEKESFDRSSYFFKVMLGDFAQKLRIPPAFVSKLRNETETGSIVILQGPSSEHWVVKLSGTGTQMEFGQGWETFVHQNAIELGDFLVFKYVSTSYFKVRIFGRSGCEKNVTVFDPEKTICDLRKRCTAALPASDTLPNSATVSKFDHPTVGKVLIDLVSDEEENNDGESVAENQEKKLKPSSSSPCCPLKSPGHCEPSLAGKKHKIVKSAKAKTEENSYQTAYYVSMRRPVTKAERNKALEAANSFTSNTPCCFVEMKPYHVYHTFFLSVPRKFGYSLQLSRKKMEVTLVDPNSKEWNVQYLGNRNTPALRGGWKYFSLDNNLEEGDVCVFELVDNTKMKIRVHIFRVVNECTPYKKIMEGKPMKDSIALPTFHSGKKMKINTDTREEPNPNLLGKSVGPEQGIDAMQGIKQVQGKEEASSGSNYFKFKVAKCTPQGIKQVQGKEEASSGSNYFKLKVAKCIPAISERNADCRNSPKSLENHYLVECPKKELLCHASSEGEQNSIGKDTVVLAKSITCLDGVNDKEDLIILEGNDVSRAMPLRIGVVFPSQEHILDRPLMNESVVPVLSPSPEVVSLVVALSPDEATALVDKNGEAISEARTGMRNKLSLEPQRISTQEPVED